MTSLPSGWEEVPLRDLCESVQYGYTASAKSDPVGPKFLRITDIVPQTIDWDSVPYWEIDPGRATRYLLRDGDIVIARTGATTGYAKHVRRPPKAVFASYLVRISLKPSVSHRYVGHVVESGEYKRFTYALGAGAGSAQPNANAQVLTSFAVRLPSRLEHQEKIASILSAYDDLIENNLRRIKILEEMAQAIYQEWFVDFRVPGHERVKMVESPLGRIPEGWEIGRLDDAVFLQRGFDLPVQARIPGAVPVYAATGIVGTHNQVKVKGPGVVTGRSGSLGTVLYVGEGFWPLNTTLWVREFRRMSPLCAYYLLQTIGLGQFNSGAAVPTLNRNDVHGLPVVLPPASAVHLFDSHVKPIHQLIAQLRRAADTLRETHDLLLPKLISGELDVSDLDIAMSEVAA